MKYFLFIIVLFFQFSGYSQEVIDLIEGDKQFLWTTANGNIHSWNIDNNIPELQTGSFHAPFPNLAIGYVKISSDTLLNTFIAAEEDQDITFGKIYYWDGQTWEKLIETQIKGIQGIGSFKEHLFIKSQSQTGSKIHYYDGTELVRLEFPLNFTGISDIAVDENGIAWYPSHNFINGQFKIDTIHIFNAELSFHEKYPMEENICGFGAYGTTIIDDTLYIGFNNSNLDFPRKVIGLTIENGIAQRTNKIVDFQSGFSDLASSNLQKDSILTSTQIIENTGFKIYPNPLFQKIFVVRPHSKQSELYVFSTSGKIVFKKQIIERISLIDLTKLPLGNYYLQIDGITKKIMKN